MLSYGRWNLEFGRSVHNSGEPVNSRPTAVHPAYNDKRGTRLRGLCAEPRSSVGEVHRLDYIHAAIGFSLPVKSNSVRFLVSSASKFQIK